MLVYTQNKFSTFISFSVVALKARGGNQKGFYGIILISKSWYDDIGFTLFINKGASRATEEPFLSKQFHKAGLLKPLKGEKRFQGPPENANRY